jgi:hypothetical protein
MTPLRRITITGLVCCLGAASALALAACSDDDIVGDDAGDRVELSVTETDLSPGRVTVTAGEVEFVVRNDGDRLHSFAIATPDGVQRSENVKPGETTNLTADLAAGTYRMYDPRGGYRSRGVSGTVVVREDEPRTVTERTVERTVVDEDDDIDLPEVEEPEIQEPEVQEPAPAPAPQPAPPPTVTKTVPAPPPPPPAEPTTTP